MSNKDGAGNDGTGKSMDDVLSSIRKIIGEEAARSSGPMPLGQPVQPGGGQQGSGPMPLGQPVQPGDAEKTSGPMPLGQPVQPGDAAKASGPMPLGQPVQPGDAAKASGPMPLGQPAAPGSAGPLSLTPNMRAGQADAPAMAPAGREDEEEETAVIDEAALEEMISRVVREEIDALSEDEAAADERAREVARAEVTAALRKADKAIGERVRQLIAQAIEARPAPDEARVKALIAEAGGTGPDEARLRAIVSEMMPEPQPAGPDEARVRAMIAEATAGLSAGPDEDRVRALAAEARPDADALREAARQAVTDLINAGAFDARLRTVVATAPDEDRVRELLKEELTGETGKTVSRNVVRLVRSEVQKLTGGGAA